MDIAGVSYASNVVSSYGIGSSVSPVSLQEYLGVAMLEQTMELNEALNTQLIQAMEHSVMPHLGGNIDTYI